MNVKEISKTSQRTRQARVRVTVQFLKADICNLQLQQKCVRVSRKKNHFAFPQ